MKIEKNTFVGVMIFMEIFFLGTSASEGIPSIFCNCRYCNQARELGGKNFRARSAIKMGDRYMIDFGPDTVSQHLKFNKTAIDLEHVLITHSHEDHFNFADLIMRECATVTNGKTLHIYVSRPAYDWCIESFKMIMGKYPEDGLINGNSRLIPLDYFQTYDIGDLQIETIKGNHNGFGKGEKAINYLVTFPDQKQLLYATDTGYYTDETWDYLKTRNHPLDVLIMENTFGDTQLEKGAGHLDNHTFFPMLEKMTALNTINDKTKIYATHLNHKHTLLHDDMQKFFDETTYSITMAWDGLSLS